MAREFLYSVDIEKDLHGNGYKGVTEGLKKFEAICDRYDIKPALFVSADCIKLYPSIFKRLSKKGWDVSLHGLTHQRFDEMDYEEKEREITESLKIWKKNLGFRPKGFRAPQHSIDEETLDLLEKYGFEYDSSYTPLNLLQLFFFPEKISLWLRQFFSPLNPYKIRRNLTEYPVSSLILPPVSLVVRVLPYWMSKVQFELIKLICKKPIFYSHSWDFIELKDSRTDAMFSHKNFIIKLERLMADGKGIKGGYGAKK